MTREEEMLELLREVVEQEPMNHCADEGTSCIFCGAEWNNASMYRRDIPGIVHEEGCWILRAEKHLS